MKTRLFFSLSVALLILAGCGQKATEPVVISGKALNYSDSILFVTIDNVKDTIRLAADGSFTKEILIERPIYPNFQGNRLFAYLWLSPGGSLTIDFDATDFKNTLKFGGDLGLPNSWLLKKTDASRQNYMAINAAYRAPNQAADFRRVCDSVYAVEQGMFDGFLAENPDLDADFIRMEKIAVKYSWLANLQSYPTRVNYYNDQATVPDDWFNFMEGVSIDDPALLDVPDAKYFLVGLAGDKALKRSGIEQKDSWANPTLLRTTFEVVENEFTHPEVVDVLLFEKLKQHLDATSPDGIGDLVELYLALAVDAKRAETISKLYDEWQALAAGQPAPAFTVVDIEGNEHSLSDFAGKLVFIDFWATWCGPCKVEIPFLKQLHEDYKDTDLVVISISVDKDKAAWEKMITDEGYEWLQYHDGVNANDLYMVKYIPTFVLIGRDGNLINVRAPNPSSDQLRPMIDKALGGG